MEQLREWSALAANSLNEFITAIAGLLPKLLGALILFLIGWLLARILRGLTQKLINALDRLLQRFALTATAEYKRLRQTSTSLLSGFVFWLVIFVFLAAAASILQLQIFTRWFDALLLYLPKLIAGSVIILSGVIVSSAARSMVTHAVSSARIHQSELFGRIVQITVIIAAFAIGIGQLGIDVSFLTDLVMVVFAVTLGAFALGIALATPLHISNLISAHGVRRSYHEGDEIIIGEHRGRILVITQNNVVIETELGETTLPAKMFAELPVSKILPQESHGE
ncbi:MAG: hypothetical protein GC149_14825 [Gammaproteobacteria bacterium]|nr:hypothetical protein [Gammaproteobacteria bacterium]